MPPKISKDEQKKKKPKKEKIVLSDSNQDYHGISLKIAFNGEPSFTITKIDKISSFGKPNEHIVRKTFKFYTKKDIKEDGELFSPSYSYDEIFDNLKSTILSGIKNHRQRFIGKGVDDEKRPTYNIIATIAPSGLATITVGKKIPDPDDEIVSTISRKIFRFNDKDNATPPASYDEAFKLLVDMIHDADRNNIEGQGMKKRKR
jgi:hypothetical protein